MEGNVGWGGLRSNKRWGPWAGKNGPSHRLGKNFFLTEGGSPPPPAGVAGSWSVGWSDRWAVVESLTQLRRETKLGQGTNVMNRLAGGRSITPP